MRKAKLITGCIMVFISIIFLVLGLFDYLVLDYLVSQISSTVIASNTIGGFILIIENTNY